MTNLLADVGQIKQKYDAILDATGERFNVFNILRIWSNEIQHSRFIAELLNPKGSHGIGHIPLKLFLQTVLPQDIEDNICKGANIETEKPLGRISTEYNSGGSVDIAIELEEAIHLPNKFDKDKKPIAAKVIHIENKIYAKDQPKQVKRYSEEGAHIFYLTLDGRGASSESLDGMGPEDYIQISYKDNITQWLEKCINAAATKPLLRETIAQYLHLIKWFTPVFSDTV